MRVKNYKICNISSSFQVYIFFVLIIILYSCSDKERLFHRISSGYSGIRFANNITENDSINPIDMEFLYNGGGVAVGDFNNDGLQDLYFTGSEVGNKLYLNKGDFHFEDITEEAKVTGEGRWCNGASVVDINNDGLLDIYICASIKKNPAQRTNLLYVNQGLDKNGIPVFREMAAEYGLADTSYSVQAAFFDYDNDGDLDMYLLTTKPVQRDVAQFNSNRSVPDSASFDKLFRNDWSDSLKHPVFTDVSKQAGIKDPGYGLGVGIADINNDGWKDIYVSNDFLGSDVLYINNKDGTFTNKINECMKHTSRNAMGNDIADINNDGLADIITVDMDPEDNFRKKKNMPGNNYAVYQNMIYENYTLQYVRNTLQLNQGPKISGSDSLGEPVFSDISFFAGVAQTDWSWNPSLADFDNDGYRDILITNGYPKDITDHDFAAFRKQSGANVSKQELLAQIPQIKIPNYAFRNKGNLQFEDKTKAWGLDEPSFSNGAVYVDLDNDGDLDYVVNNINQEAFIYENLTRRKSKKNNAASYIDIDFKGDRNNIHGLGAFATIYYDHGKIQVYENNPCRGYLSTVQAKAHFGLGSISKIDSVLINWQDGKKQLICNVASNQKITVDHKDAIDANYSKEKIFSGSSIFTEVTHTYGVNYEARESDYIDFDFENLLPHKLSQYGPALAAGDIDGNGLDDIFIGSPAGQYHRKYLLQQPGGKFIEKEMPQILAKDARLPENMGLLLFDADGDGDLDLYCSSGSNEFAANTKNYQDLFFVNDGKGNFRFDSLALPKNFTSKSCVKAADFDRDGKLDLFIGGRVLPGNYPMPVSSFIYRNESKSGQVRFTDVTSSVAADLNKIGMVCDAIWTDFDNDGWVDLIVVGEWMHISFFRNDHGKLVNVSDQSGVSSETGWWNSIVAGDFDNDGDIDYIVGNLGLNSFYQASHEHPVSIYAKDFDKNGILDAVTTVYLKDESGNLREFPAASRDDIIKQLPGLRKKFPYYKDFGNAGMYDLFDNNQLKEALIYRANNFASCYLENLGHGKFKMHPLPAMAQLAPLYGMAVDDYNQDGNLDVVISGNDFGTEVTNGRYDAFNGLLLLGDGKGNFIPQTILESGIYIPGDAKALVKLKGALGDCLLAASQNRGPLKIFKYKSAKNLITLQANDRILMIHLKNGSVRRQELYYGDSFLSQSSRFINADSSIKKIIAIDENGHERVTYDIYKKAH